jgi:predicted DNA-binding protein
MSEHERAAAEWEAEATDAAEAFTRREVELDYSQAGTVSPPPPPETEPTVLRGLRLPVSLDRRARQAAEAAGVSFSAVVREWIELGLTETSADHQVSLAAVRRAIAHAAQSGSGRAA